MRLTQRSPANKEHIVLKPDPSKRLGRVLAVGKAKSTRQKEYTTLKPIPSKRLGRIPEAGYATLKEEHTRLKPAVT